MPSSCAWAQHQPMLLKATIIHRISTECNTQSTSRHSSFCSSFFTCHKHPCAVPREDLLWASGWHHIGHWGLLAQLQKTIPLVYGDYFLETGLCAGATGPVLIWMVQYMIQLLEGHCQVSNQTLLCHYSILNPFICPLRDLMNYSPSE